MIVEILVLGVLGLISALGLELASGMFKGEEEGNEDIEAIMEILPEVDCGACGNPSCQLHAEELLVDSSKLGNCAVISDEDKEKIADILGEEYEA